MCVDAVSSKHDTLRVRDDNPATNVAGPDRGAKTAKQYLYPNELSRFVACEGVPLLWRRIVALMVYLYPRPGELRELRWEDVDLAHGTVHFHQVTDRETHEAKATKTDVARRFSIEPRLLPLLKAMHEASGGEGRVIDLPCDRDLARGFRLWLKRAKVDRAELHMSTRTRKNITVYDLRATGITWCAIRGDEPLRIKQRAGQAPASRHDRGLHPRSRGHPGGLRLGVPTPTRVAPQWNFAPSPPRIVRDRAAPCKASGNISGEGGIRKRGFCRTHGRSRRYAYE